MFSFSISIEIISRKSIMRKVKTKIFHISIFRVKIKDENQAREAKKCLLRQQEIQINVSHRLKRKKKRDWLTVANDAKMPSQIKMGKNLMDITGLSPEVIKDGTYFGVGWRVNSNCYSLSRCKNPRFPSKYLKLLNKTTNNNNNKMGTWT